MSSTSDCAATQAKFNDLLQKEIGDRGANLVENKCSMHLGVNLRHACVKACAEVVMETDSSSDIPDSESESSMLSDSDDENVNNEPKGDLGQVRRKQVR